MENKEMIHSNFPYQINRLQHQREKEGTVQDQLKQEAEYLREQLDQCVKKNEQLEREALDLRYQMITLQNEQSYTTQYCSDKQRAHQQQPEQLGLFQQVKKTPKTSQRPLSGHFGYKGHCLDRGWKQLMPFVSQGSPKPPAAIKDHTISEMEERIEKLESDLSQVLKELERSRQQHQDQVDNNKALERKLERSCDPDYFFCAGDRKGKQILCVTDDPLTVFAAQDPKPTQ